MSDPLLTEYASSIMNTYQRFPLTIVKGRGSKVWDEEGKEYLDFTSGIATCNLGHVPAAVKEKLSVQLDALWHCSNLYRIPIQEQLASLLTENSCMDQVFFCNSGAEANEAAIKLAKKYAKDSGNEKRTEIITFRQSFHGRTGSTMAATGQDKIHQGFTPLTPGFRHLPYNDMSALDEIDTSTAAAVLLELVQGEGGVVPASHEWISELAGFCKKNGILLMVDEIQTGMGRTGTLFAYEQYGIEPDVITAAKGLGSGFPIGAMLAKGQAAASFSPGTHGSTFGGNPLAAAAGHATLETMLQEKVPLKASAAGEWLMQQLDAFKSHGIIKEVRGKGLLIGIELTVEAGPLIVAMRKKGVLVLSAGANVLRILPPLTVEREEMELFIDRFGQVLNELEGVKS